MRKILVVEDEESIREYITELLTREGYRVLAADGEQDIKDTLSKFSPHIVITDLRLPNKSGIDVVKTVKHLNPEAVCIIITAYATVESAVEAMKAGAFTYLKKPFSKEDLLLALKEAECVYGLKRENNLLRQELQRRYEETILGSSPAIEKVRSLIRKVADSDSTVLILGESGTGKELVARALHNLSSRYNKPFIPINSGAIPESLLESELFGYEKGAFTNAFATKVGKLEAADGGTVFFDEIGDMSPALQVKVLRVLQEREFERIGGRKTIKVDIRVIAATNRNLEEMVKNKSFREDLYYRLNVIPIQLPPLRERKEDIPVLVAHFIDTLSKQKRRNISGIEPDAMKLLTEYHWPGNVRELENLMERVIILKGEGRITRQDIEESLHVKKLQQEPSADTMELPPEGVDFNTEVHEFEKKLILTALKKNNWIKKKAADYLSLNRTTLIEKMKRMGLLS